MTCASKAARFSPSSSCSSEFARTICVGRRNVEVIGPRLVLQLTGSETVGKKERAWLGTDRPKLFLLNGWKEREIFTPCVESFVCISSTICPLFPGQADVAVWPERLLKTKPRLRLLSVLTVYTHTSVSWTTTKSLSETDSHNNMNSETKKKDLIINQPYPALQYTQQPKSLLKGRKRKKRTERKKREAGGKIKRQSPTLIRRSYSKRNLWPSPIDIGTGCW